MKFFLSGLSDCEDVLPIYIGDDRTDEDAFKVKSGSVIRRCFDGLVPNQLN